MTTATLRSTRGLAASALLFVLASAPVANCFGLVPTTTTLRFASRAKNNHHVVLMAEPITMPALSSTMKEGRVVSWLKSEGDAIDAGEAIMVVESDKADMDVEAFEEGFLAKILTQEGDMAPVGQVVALIAAMESEIPTVIAAYEAQQQGGGGAVSAAPVAAETTTAAAAATTTGGESTTMDIFMPALSSTMSEGKVVEWLKNVGDYVQAGEAIMVVESDKADMDVEAFEDGYLAAIFKQAGETAIVGETLATLVTNQADIMSYSTTTDPIVTLPIGAAPDCEFSQIDMPALSSTMKEGKVVSWLKAEGDAISSGEAIMVVESDKADMDVEAFDDGFLAAIITQEGESGAVGAPVALIAMNEADIPALQAYAATLSGNPPPAAAMAPPAVAAAAKATPTPKTATPANGGDRIVASPFAKKRADELGIDLSAVVGTGPNGRVTASDVESFASSAPKSGASSTKAAAATTITKAWTPAAGVIAATPTARALAKKSKIDLATITGTGQFGRVTLDDVMIANGEKKVERKKAPVSGAAAAVEMPDGFVPFTGMQRAVSKNMEATLSIPEFRVSREIQMDKFDELYQGLKAKGVTVSALIAKAVALAIEKHPLINSSYSNKDGGGIQYNKDINIAMAVAIDGGLITPTLKYANERSIMDLGEDWKELVGKAKAGTLKPDEYNSGTFTISNMGMFGVTQFGAILPAGTGGILAIGATQEHIVPCSQAIMGMKKVKKMVVTLTCDHRQIYGSDAALFLKTLADIMENQLGKLTA